MSNDNTALLEAIEVAMEAEMKANQFYKDAETKVSDPRGKDLLGQLADFEQNHYNKLKELKSSLSAKGEFIKYEGTEFKPCAKGCSSEVSGALAGQKDALVEILNLAIEAESRAHERYKELSQKATDPKGQQMFAKLANEELLHRRILSDEFYHISNKGLWVWSE